MTREDILNFARLLLTQCDGAVSRDKKGYDVFDAVTIRQMLNPDINGVSYLEDEEVEYLRLKLLRYVKQVRKIARAHNIPEDQIAEGIKKLEEPVATCSVIVRGQIKKGSPYGRISLKWVRDFLEGKHEVKTIKELDFYGNNLENLNMLTMRKPK